MTRPETSKSKTRQAQHTPGPWEVSKVENGIVRIDGGGRVGIAWVPLPLDIAEGWATARLIAVAPLFREGVIRCKDLRCEYDALNPCWANRQGDVLGKHWGGGDACGTCTLASAVAAVDGNAATATARGEDA